MKKFALLAVLMLSGCNVEVQANEPVQKAPKSDGAVAIMSCADYPEVDGQSFWNVRLREFNRFDNSYYVTLTNLSFLCNPAISNN